ncbi:MAG: 50S ribosomal protein L11, partial [Candidatus Nanoarchaeia archaeon]|nr:50S ribosomal protein L11 [Candidatus Nanoarchaeia archaeon]
MVDIKLLVEGGKMTPTPAIAQQLGPMGINIGQVISDVNSKTGDFKGINVPVILKVDSKTKNYTIEVLSPPTSELLKKELGITKASSNRIQIQVGNIA